MKFMSKFLSSPSFCVCFQLRFYHHIIGYLFYPHLSVTYYGMNKIVNLQYCSAPSPLKFYEIRF